MDSLVSFLPLIGVAVVFYFFMLRPQMQRQKEQLSFLDKLEKGNTVVTSSGIIGKINRIEEGIVYIEVDSKAYIKMTKNSISKELTESYAKTGVAEASKPS